MAIEHAAGNSGALTMERRSRRADGLARSLSRAGGINETGAKGEISPLASQLSLPELKMRKVVAPKADKGLGGRLPFAGGSFDLATSRNRPIHETTNCPRKPRNTHLQPAACYETQIHCLVYKWARHLQHSLMRALQGPVSSTSIPHGLQSIQTRSDTKYIF